MIKFIFTFLLLGFSTWCYSQETEECFQPTIVYGSETLQQSRMKTPKRLTDFEPVTFNIFFWGFKKENNTGNDLFTLENIETAVANLNTLYNNCNITFSLLGYDTILSNSFYVLESPIEFETLLLTMFEDGYIKDNAFNVYVSNKYEGFGGIASEYHSTIIGIPSFHLLNSGVLEHEVGHCFNLYHTNDAHSGLTCESAIRDPNNPYYNADIAGDQVADTAAGYRFLSGEIDPDTCTLNTSKLDCYGIPYNIPSSFLHNFMTRSSAECSKDQLTFGQYVRIRQAIINDPLGKFADATVK